MTLTWTQRGNDEMRTTGRYVTWSVQWLGDRCGLFVEAKDLPPFQLATTQCQTNRPDVPVKAQLFLQAMEHAQRLDEESGFLADLVEAERARLEALRRAL